MKHLDITALYNWEIKKHYIEDITDNNESRRTLYFAFKKTSKLENQLKKDLYEMTKQDIEAVLYSAGRSTTNSVRALASNIATYINWASKNGYRSTNMPMFTAESFSSNAEKYVSKTKSIYFTQDDLMDYYNNEITNPQDVLLLQCMFEGIRGQGSSEVFNLKISDVYEENDKYYADLFDTERGTERLGFEISYFLYKQMHIVNEMEFIEDKRGKQNELVPSPYILKRTHKGKKSNTFGDRLTSSYLTNKASFFKNEVFNTKNFRFKDIEKSGVMYYLYQIMKQKDNSKEVTNNELKMISDKFNVGKYTHSFYEEEVVNYTVVKDLIDVDFYSEHYGEIVLA